jgi:hypothetical protein
VAAENAVIYARGIDVSALRCALPSLWHRNRRPAPLSQFPSGIVNSVSFVSTTNTARSLAGLVLLALALTS